MDLWDEEAILGYCLSSVAERTAFWDEGDSMPRVRRPWRIISLFEMLRAVHWGLRHGRVRVEGFRECWIAAMNDNWQRCGDGLIIRVFEHMLGETDHLVRDLWSEMTKMGRPDTDKTGSGRDGDEEDRVVFRWYFRRLAQLRHQSIIGEVDERRCWSERIVDELPLDFPTDGRDLVLDTNVFVDLLNVLPIDGRMSATIRVDRRLEAALAPVRRRFDQILATHGTAGKLIVPLPVLVETYGVIRHRPPSAENEHARAVIQNLNFQGDQWPLWTAFSFEDLSFELLAAYLVLYDTLGKFTADPKAWPSFTDSFIVAHGLVNGCPIVSSEWNEKKDWNGVKACFNFLHTPSTARKL